MQSLWKYLSLSPDQDPPWQDRVEQLVVQGLAYCPSPRQFNDPFDCLPFISAPKSREEIEAKMPNLIARMVESLYLPAETIASKMEEGLLNRSPEDLEILIRASIARTSANMGVFCLAECIESVLMWSHYASNHQGIALRFDIGFPVRNGLPPFFKVQYDQERPSLGEFFEGTHKKSGITDALATKAKFWEYEQEWRSFLPDGAGQFAKFDPSVVSGIIFGASCSASNQAKVREIVHSRNIEFFKAEPAHDTFRLNFVSIQEV